MPIGTVEKLEKGFAIVTMERQDMCGECHACEMIGETKSCTVKCINDCDSQVGDKVEIDVAKASFLQATLIMYGVPLLGLLIGIGLGSLISEVVSIILGILGMGLTYLIVRWGDKNNKYNKMLPSIVKIIK